MGLRSTYIEMARSERRAAQPLPADVIRLVLAARVIAFGEPSPETIAELDAASEAFADRVPWEDEPED